MLRALLCLVLIASAGSGFAQCRQALALGLDVSGSVDSTEYALQMNGLAGALQQNEVRAALLGMPELPVQIAIYEWSGVSHQRLLIDWTAIRIPADLDRITATLRSTVRASAPPGTALGTALQYGADLLAQTTGCWMRTLDISGDGKHNTGPNPREIRPILAARGMTVNALVIGADAPSGGDHRQVRIGELSSYFRALVITGPDAFVETALGFQDFEAAMTRKLLRELRQVALSHR